MHSKMFKRDGTLHFPEGDIRSKTPEPVSRPEYTITEVYCRNGHNLVTDRHKIDGKPGIHIAFVRPNEEKGEVVLSPVLGSLNKIALSGNLVEGEALALYCPVCSVKLDVLCNCEFHPDASVCVLYLLKTPDMDAAIAFCCIVGCPNSSYRKTGEVIRAISRSHL